MNLDYHVKNLEKDWKRIKIGDKSLIRNKNGLLLKLG